VIVGQFLPLLFGLRWQLRPLFTQPICLCSSSWSVVIATVFDLPNTAQHASYERWRDAPPVLGTKCWNGSLFLAESAPCSSSSRRPLGWYSPFGRCQTSLCFGRSNSVAVLKKERYFLDHQAKVVIVLPRTADFAGFCQVVERSLSEGRSNSKCRGRATDTHVIFWTLVSSCH